MKSLNQFIFSTATMLALMGCGAEDSCDDYYDLTAWDQNTDGVTDHRIQFIGDSIIAYHEINCRGVSNQVGFAIQEQVTSHAVIGAKVHEIEHQFQPASEGTDYSLIVINGGLNDLIADVKVGNPDATPCNCNEKPNHDACLQEVEDVSNRMQNLINNLQTQSNADIAIMSYYPAEVSYSFIGQCFPYVEMMHNNYRAMAQENGSITFVETYGENRPIIEKVNQYGYDQYHPTQAGSEQLAQFIVKQTKLQELTPEVSGEE